MTITEMAISNKFSPLVVGGAEYSTSRYLSKFLISELFKTLNVIWKQRSLSQNLLKSVGSKEEALLKPLKP